MANGVTHIKPGATASALERNPLQFSYGVLLTEKRMFNGMDWFSWFADEARAMAYLRNDVWADLGFSADEDIPSRALFRSVLSSETGLTEAIIDKLNEAQDDIQIQWIGRFNNLFNGADAFAVGLLEEFHELRASGEVQRTESMTKDYIVYLSRFRTSVHMPQQQQAVRSAAEEAIYRFYKGPIHALPDKK